MRLRLLLSTVAILAAVALTGCGQKGSDDAAKGTGTPTNKEALDDLSRMLKDFDQKKQKPPAKIAAVESVEPVFPAAYIALVKGEIVYAWGVPVSSGSSSVLAYEKKVPAEGGWVLLQDGTVKEMTATEFAAAPKAK